MTTINIYLTFDGNCEQAFELYQSAFKTEPSVFQRFGEMPPSPEVPEMDKATKNRVMHVSLPISKETVLMGSDTGGEWSAPHQPGNNFSISIGTDSKAEADRLFAVLSDGGEVGMPMQDTFWNSYFGTLVDRFGIAWMVSFDQPKDK